ncbi:hypothetical protein HELRODRAFT_157895 [Helobdella robusta]|uniref:Exocyst complex component 3-like protein n=1 Tax=Helobdella robusta TaxID=6412 RepID=T1EMH5_HELRO|nr:hypothetical protein HELRODRAFT_157895 [Helobdella robusta]ESN93347.1 hypothetical protein HELRODRAFT_157895 [Helobdella robusta]
MEMQAKEHAKHIVANYLQRPDQLEKTEQLRKSVARQKGSVEAMLKTAIQSQLDGVKTGLNQLNTVLKDIKEIKSNMTEIRSTYLTIADLQSKLKNIREENSKHSQLAAACDNVLHIFTVPETIKKCEDLINDGKLLHAHKSISDLEKSKDDILYELNKQPNKTPMDQLIVLEYFSGLDDLVQSLEKQLWLILQRTIISLRVEPTIIVTVLRIIEREEKLDAVMSNKYEEMKLPGRPKKWKEKAMDTINKAVLLRIEGNQMEDRTTNKMWLVRHLEVTRQIVLEDLRVVKTLCGQCFPPHYNMVEKYIEMYHMAISTHLNEIIEQGLEGNEIVSLLNWINDYSTTELMGHPDLNIDVNKYPPLIEKSKINDLYSQYIMTLKRNMKEWMVNSIKTDSKDWSKDQLPDTDDKGFFNTTLPVLLIQMIEQNLEVAKTIGNELVVNVVIMCIEEMKEFAQLYKSELKIYRDIHLADRSSPKYYLHFIIANTNNCQSFADFIIHLHKDYLTHADVGKIKSLLDMFNNLADLLCVWLIEEVFSDLEPHIQELLTKKWTTSSSSVDTICITIEDYCQDFVHIKDVFYNEMINRARLRLAKEYYKAILARKIMFKNYEERGPACEKIIREADQMDLLFQKLIKNDKHQQESPFAGIPLFIELLKMRDTSMLSLELSGFVNKYPDIKIDMVVNILLMRGDMSRSDARFHTPHQRKITVSTKTMTY